MQPAPLRQSEKGAHKLQDVPKDCSEVLGAYLEQELVTRPIMLRVKKLCDSILILHFACPWCVCGRNQADFRLEVKHLEGRLETLGLSAEIVLSQSPLMIKMNLRARRTD